MKIPTAAAAVAHQELLPPSTGSQREPEPVQLRLFCVGATHAVHRSYKRAEIIKVLQSPCVDTACCEGDWAPFGDGWHESQRATCKIQTLLSAVGLIFRNRSMTVV